jgi:hypothetical protein
VFRLAHALQRPVSEIEALPYPVFVEWLAFFEILESERKRK